MGWDLAYQPEEKHSLNRPEQPFDISRRKPVETMSRHQLNRERSMQDNLTRWPKVRIELATSRILADFFGGDSIQC
jgi:hypothetical protein